MWRAIRWRAGSSAMFFAVAVAAIMAATAGPVYLRAADQSLVVSTLEHAGVLGSGVTLTPENNGMLPPAALEAAAAAVPGRSGASPRDRFSPAVTTVDLAGRVFSPVSGLDDIIQLVSRTGACAHLRLQAGHCPQRPGEVMLSARSAAAVHAGVGSTVDIVPPHRGRAVALVVSGLFAPGSPSAPAWWGLDYFPFGQTQGHTPQLDDAFVTEQGALSLTSRLPSSDWLQLALRPRRISASAVPSVLGGLAGWTETLQTKDSIRVGTNLPRALGAAESQEHFAETIVTMVSLELVLLALLVLYAVARATSGLREADVRVAALRGLPRRRVVRLALREPALLLVAALPVGIGLTYALMAAVDRHVLGAAAGSGLDSLALEAALAGCLAGIVSAALGSRALLSGQAAEERSEAGRQRRLRNAGIIDALGVALAVAGLAELVGQSGHQHQSVSPVAYLGPGLLALGAGVLAARLVPLGSRLAANALTWSRRGASILASRSLARREGLARRVLIPTIATGLLVFAVAGLTVASANHATQAEFAVGAPVVLDVQPAPGVNLVTAVRHADPGGHEAMAAADISAPDGRTLAVDASRFAAVASWPSGLTAASAAEVARSLVAKVPPPRMIPPARSLAFSIDVPRRLQPLPDLQVALYDVRNEGQVDLDVGGLRPGLHRYLVPISGLCPSQCRLDQLVMSWTAPTLRARPGSAAAKRLRLARDFPFVLRSISAVGPAGVARPVRAELTASGTWQANSAALVSPSPSGLSVQADLLSPNGQATVSPFDVPSVLPAVATRALVNLDASASSPNQALAVGLDQSQLTIVARSIVPALPSVGADSSMIDLGLAEREQAGQALGVTWQVWCHRAPSPALLGRLRAAGVRLLSARRARTVLTGIDHTGPSFGFDLYGLAAGGAALLALGALLFAMASDARERRIEYSGLEAVGVPRSTLLGALLLESSTLSLVGAVAGTAAAALSSYLALQFLPEFPPGRVGAPLAVGLPWAVVALTGVAMFVALELAAVAASLVLVRGVRPELLRLAR